VEHWLVDLQKEKLLLLFIGKNALVARRVSRVVVFSCVLRVLGACHVARVRVVSHNVWCVASNVQCVVW
jgi:hypothetical protein